MRRTSGAARTVSHVRGESEVDNWKSWEYGSFNCDDKGIDRPALRYKRKRLDPMWSHISDEAILKGIQVLEQFISNERKQKFDSLLSNRTQSFRFVFENPSNPNNVWAALRTFDAFGIQNVDIVLNNTNTKISETIVDCGGGKSDNLKFGSRKGTMNSALGAQKWLTLREHNDSANCIRHLKEQGYLIYATDIHSGAIALTDINWNAECDVKKCEVSTTPLKVAIVMGNELTGISNEMKKLADKSFYIPMKGFAESLNLSVACAVICTTLQCHRQLNGDLDPLTRNRILFSWLTRTVKGSMGILRRYEIQGIRASDNSVFNSIGSTTTRP